jgi:hypothetical protein
VVGHDLRFNDVVAMFICRLLQNLLQALPHLGGQDSAPVFRDPDEMIGASSETV